MPEISRGSATIGGVTITGGITANDIDQLNTNLQRILTEKNTKLNTNTLRNTSFFDIQGRPDELILYPSIQDRDNAKDNVELGQKSVVYSTIIQDVSKNIVSKTFKIKPEFTLETKPSRWVNNNLDSYDFNDDHNIYASVGIGYDPNQDRVSIYISGTNIGYTNIQYTNNGEKYVLTDESYSNKIITLPCKVGYTENEWNTWTDTLNPCLETITYNFGGLFENDEKLDKDSFGLLPISDFNIHTSELVSYNPIITLSKEQLVSMVPIIENIANDLGFTNFAGSLDLFCDNDNNLYVGVPYISNYSFGGSLSILYSDSTYTDKIGLCFYGYPQHISNTVIKIYKVNIDNGTYTLMDTYDTFLTETSNWYYTNTFPNYCKSAIFSMNFYNVQTSSSLNWGCRFQYLTNQNNYVDISNVFDTIRYWKGMNTQFNLKNTNQLMPGIVALGENGQITGDGSIYDVIKVDDLITNLTNTPLRTHYLGPNTLSGKYIEQKQTVTMDMYKNHISKNINIDLTNYPDINYSRQIYNIGDYLLLVWTGSSSSASHRFVILDYNGNELFDDTIDFTADNYLRIFPVIIGNDIHMSVIKWRDASNQYYGKLVFTKQQDGTFTCTKTDWTYPSGCTVVNWTKIYYDGTDIIDFFENTSAGEQYIYINGQLSFTHTVTNNIFGNWYLYKSYLFCSVGDTINTTTFYDYTGTVLGTMNTYLSYTFITGYDSNGIYYIQSNGEHSNTLMELDITNFTTNTIFSYTLDDWYYGRSIGSVFKDGSDYCVIYQGYFVSYINGEVSFGNTYNYGISCGPEHQDGNTYSITKQLFNYAIQDTGNNMLLKSSGTVKTSGNAPYNVPVYDFIIIQKDI